jgi:hypothetical protein
LAGLALTSQTVGVNYIGEGWERGVGGVGQGRGWGLGYDEVGGVVRGLGEKEVVDGRVGDMRGVS